MASNPFTEPQWGLPGRDRPRRAGLLPIHPFDVKPTPRKLRSRFLAEKISKSKSISPAIGSCHKSNSSIMFIGTTSAAALLSISTSSSQAAKEQGPIQGARKIPLRSDLGDSSI